MCLAEARVIPGMLQRLSRHIKQVGNSTKEWTLEWTWVMNTIEERIARTCK